MPTDKQEKQPEVDAGQRLNPSDAAADLSSPVRDEEERVSSLEEALSILEALPQFPEVDAALREKVEPLIREMEVSPAPRRQAILFFDMNAEHYLAFVENRKTIGSYRRWLHELLYPHAW